MELSEKDRRIGIVDLLTLALGTYGLAMPIVYGLASAISGSTAFASHLKLIPGICEQIRFWYCDVHYHPNRYISQDFFVSYLICTFYYVNMAAVAWVLIIPVSIIRYVRGVASGGFARRSTMDWKLYNKYVPSWLANQTGFRLETRPLRMAVAMLVCICVAVDSLFFGWVPWKPDDGLRGFMREEIGNPIIIMGSNFMIQAALFAFVPLIVWRSRHGKSIRAIYFGENGCQDDGQKDPG